MSYLPENDNQIVKLTEDFYKNYSKPLYSEILKKGERPYNCILFQTHYDYLICVPYRTNISHKNAFLFNESVRSKGNNSGLDYSKIIIVNNLVFIDSKDAIIDRDEYRETFRNLDTIKKEALEYVEKYVNHIVGTDVISAKRFRKKYYYSTLKYFHKELGISDTGEVSWSRPSSDL